MAPRTNTLRGDVSGGNTTLFKLKNGKYVRKRKVQGGNTNLYKLKKGKYIRKKLEGGGIFNTIIKHMSRHKGKILNVGRTVGKKLLKETESQLRKPKNQRLLKTVTDRVIEEVANKLDHQIPSEKKVVVLHLFEEIYYLLQKKKPKKSQGKKAKT